MLNLLKDEFATDYNGQQFLLFDSRINEPDETVIFIFMTQRGVQRLIDFPHWSADGTFKILIYILFPIGFLTN
jgi:hypothetical protein